MALQGLNAVSHNYSDEQKSSWFIMEEAPNLRQISELPIAPV